VTFAMGACRTMTAFSTFDAMSQIQIVVGMVSDLDAISVPDVSMAMMFVPDFVAESFTTGDGPVVGGQTVFVHKANVRSKPPL
jgi:hypothetical protein